MIVPSWIRRSPVEALKVVVFPAPLGAQERNDLSRLNLKADPLQDEDDRVVDDLEVLDLGTGALLGLRTLATRRARRPSRSCWSYRA